jgi:hypothetical protein
MVPLINLPRRIAVGLFGRGVEPDRPGTSLPQKTSAASEGTEEPVLPYLRIRWR